MVTTPVSDTWGHDLSGERGSVVVIGLGYIGLPTAVVLAHNGWDVTGVDVSSATLASVAAGKLPFLEEGLEELLDEAVAAGRLRTDSEIPAAERFIISVPTPMTEAHEADLGAVRAVFESLARVLRGGETVILESTSPTGTTREMAERVQELRPDLVVDGVGDDAVAARASAPATEAVYVAYAPERVLPGRIVAELHTNDRIVGGLSSEAAERAAALYRSFCLGEVVSTTAPTAELVKLSENAFRDVNIAFANELSLICADQGINVWELIRLANRHPRVNILQPGPGVGGHCIAVDPWFIVAQNPQQARLIRTAREVNDHKPEWVIEQVKAQVADCLNATNKRASELTIACFGLAFKPNIDDLRESPAMEIAAQIARWHSGTTQVVEPNIHALPKKLDGLCTLATLEAALASADVLVMLVDHNQFKAVSGDSVTQAYIIDTKGVWR